MAMITFEVVAAAAEALQAAGQRASVRAVTTAIGGGSPNTVLKLLAEWKAGRPVVRIADTELDARITDAIKVQMQRVAEAAASAAEERAAGCNDDLQAMSEAQALSEKQINALLAERDDDMALIAAGKAQLQAAQGAAAAAAEASSVEILRLKDELFSSTNKVERVSAALAKAEVRLEAVPGLQAAIERKRMVLETCQQARQQAEQECAVLAAKLEAAERRAEEADARTAKLETKVDLLSNELQASNKAVAFIQARLDGITAEYLEYQKTVAVLESKSKANEKSV